MPSPAKSRVSVKVWMSVLYGRDETGLIKMTERPPWRVSGPCQETPVMYEAWDTSANKTHLLNWLYATTVQMAKGAYVSRSEPHPFFLHVGGT